MQSSLLSPAESHAFQNFLSTMDYPDDTLTASEWAVYNSTGPMYGTHDDVLDDPGSGVNPAQREALAKATKDLMSLEPDGWNRDHAMMEDGGQSQVFDPRGQYDAQQQHHHHHQQQLQDQHQFAQRQQALHLQQQQHRHQQQQEQQHRQHSFSSGNDLFPFLHNKASASQELRYPMQQHQHPHLVPSPMNTASSDHGSPTSPHSPFHFQHPLHNLRSMDQQNHMGHPHQVHIPAHPDQQRRQQLQQLQQQQRGLSPSSSSSARNKRPSASALAGPSHSANSNAASTSTIGGRSNDTTNGHLSTNKRQRASTSPTVPPNALPPSQPGGSATKQTLLSPSQKKANHIQSEQKRRANIRRGYEALCETVPALREAIREEEEAERLAALAGGRGGGASQRKKNRGKKSTKDGEDKEKDRLDGRAGPRSENVVLSKTIEHIQALIADRSALLARLHRARSSLPPGHPALSPLMPDPPWEREWKGGNGRLGDEDMDGSEGEGDDGEDDGE